ncbi:type II secretion system protein N [Marinicella gelatinilytica]|uniref:type II secretion system protein N n=1 Tax=Marinicella gelatinilytica TaxID=2996017 RepID=UPI0022609A20|nr:type II secretion system protein N [Marinicella gelatinilytica]MCX7544285.1 type II secretion system protein N [Marinicella gelatinilytica]
MKSTTDRIIGLIKWLLILAVIIVLLLAVLPLRWYYDYASDYFKPVVLRDVSGSVIKGEAGALRYDVIPLGQAEWLLYPGSLKGIGGRVRLHDEQYDLTFKLKEINQNQAKIKQVTGYLNWAYLQPYLQIKQGRFDGYWQFAIDQLVYSKQTGIERLNGQVILKDFQLLAPNQMPLGEVKIDLETKSAGVIAGTISSNSDRLTVSGAFYIQPNRWQLNVDIVPKPGFYQLNSALQGVGDPRPGGGRRLNRAGFY